MFFAHLLRRVLVDAEGLTERRRDLLHVLANHRFSADVEHVLVHLETLLELVHQLQVAALVVEVVYLCLLEDGEGQVADAKDLETLVLDQGHGRNAETDVADVPERVHDIV